MRRGFILGICSLVLALAVSSFVRGQVVVDRIVARVENDIILLSDVSELKEYQELVNGKSESESAIVDRLIDQWIVRSEAELSRFPQPKEEEIDREVARVVKSFNSAEEYEARKKQSGLNDAEVRKIVTAQSYLDAYLDSRFRPSVQIDEKAVEDFYQSAVIPGRRRAARSLPHWRPPATPFRTSWCRVTLMNRRLAG